MKKLTHEDFEKEIKKINTNIVLLEKYKKMSKKIKCKCKKHNLIYYTYPQNLKKGCGCYKCGLEKISNKVNNNKEKIIKKLKIKNPKLKIYIKNIDLSNKNMNFICLLCNKEYTINIKRIYDYKCKNCNKIKRLEKEKG